MAEAVQTEMLTLAKYQKRRGQSSQEELSKYSREELEVRVQQLEAQVCQLKNVITKKISNDDLNHYKTTRLGQKKFNFEQSRSRHVFIKILYLGWFYDGYTFQEDTINTIEHKIFYALKTSCLIQSKETSNYHRCGRTDKGVTAFSQVISLDIRTCLSLENEWDLGAELPYCIILNRLLPDGIRAIAWSPAPEANSSSRFDCSSRTYHYTFPRGGLDINLMNEAANKLVGTHDFRNMCKMDVGNGVTAFTRSIMHANVKVIKNDNPNQKVSHEVVKADGDNQSPISQFIESPYDLCEFVITSKAFLWHQIRCITSILFLVGQGRESTNIIEELLDISKCPRKPQYLMASELPLNLFECAYDIPLKWFYDPENLTRITKELQIKWSSCVIKGQMIREMLTDLESKMANTVLSHVDGLAREIPSKVYQPLLKRQTCSSLEHQIDSFSKRRKLRYAPSSDDKESATNEDVEISATTEAK